MNEGTVVITGASSGIGEALARVYAGRGRSLALVARRAERLNRLAEELTAGGVTVETIVQDLERPDGAAALWAELERRGVVVDTLVNNAGFGLRGGFATLPADGQAAMVQLNVATLTTLCRLALPPMLARGRGGILNVASTAAFQAVPYLGVYAATKAYVLSLSEALHEEVRGSGVVVTALCPGPTATEFTVRADMEKSKLFKGAMDAATVARLAVDGHERGRAVVVTGAGNRAGVLATRFVPRAVLRRAAAWLQG